jgi:hypothetical protein
MKKFIFIGAVSAVVIATIFVYTRENSSLQIISDTPSVAASSVPVLHEPAASIEASVSSSPPVSTSTVARATVKAGDKTYFVPVTQGETVTAAMRALASTSDFIFTGRDYPGMGEFIDSINGMKNAGGLYWILYVNGVSASSGASAMTVNADDVIEWKYEKSY